MQSKPRYSPWNAFAKMFFQHRFLKGRWLAVMFFFSLTTSYVSLTVLQTARSLNSFSNVWDILISILNNPQLIHHGMTNLFIFMISDYTVYGQFDQSMLIRTGSRKTWFNYQAISIFLTAILFSALLFFMVFCIASLVSVWGWDWSPVASVIIGKQQFVSQNILQFSPGWTTFFMLVFLSLAWAGIGIVVNCITLVTQHAVEGFIAGLVLNYSAFLIWSANLQIPWLQAISFHRYMFFLSNMQDVNSLFSALLLSILYWSIWIALSLFILRRICQKKDFLVKELERQAG
jgi:hypothetical protein